MLTSVRVLISATIVMYLCLLVIVRIRHVAVVKVTVRHFWICAFSLPFREFHEMIGMSLEFVR